MLDGEHIGGEVVASTENKSLFIMLNASDKRVFIDIPDIGRDWIRMVDTSLDSPDDIFASPEEGVYVGKLCEKYRVRPGSAVILECK